MFDPRRIWSSSQLPTLPSVAVKLLELAKNPDVEIKAVVDVIKTDPAISAKILKSANSTFFGLSSKVTSVDRAIPLLGTTVVNSLALSFSLAEAAMSSGPMTEHYTAYWQQSVVQAAAAETLSSYLEGGLDCEYFLAGLLMDLGRLAMLKTVPQDYLPVLLKAKAEARNLHEVELEVLGSHHAEIGSNLMRNWNLPESLVICSAHQHEEPAELAQYKQEPNFSLTIAVAIAASLGEYFCASNKGLALQRIQTLTQTFLGLSEEGLKELLDKVLVRIRDTADLFAVKMDQIGDPSDLMAEANEQLSQLALREHVAKTQATALHHKMAQEKEELETQNQELQKQAMHDGLTKIYNRHFFDDALAREVQRCGRGATPLGLIFADIDRFKQINDTYGHQFGDLVLKHAAAAFTEVSRTSDTVARYGGEEFVVLVNQPTEKGLEKFAERLRARIEAEKIEFEQKPVKITVSIGAAMIVPVRGESNTGAKLVAAADEAMYESKEKGRNQVHLRILLDDWERRLLHSVLQRRFSRWLVQRGVLDIPTVSRALSNSLIETIRLGELGVRHGLLHEEQITTILAESERTGRRFGESAISLGYLSEEHLITLLALQQEDPQLVVATLKNLRIVDSVRIEALSREYLKEVIGQRTAVPVGAR